MSKKPVAHHELHYMLEHSDYSRVVICEKIGISRKTIYDWEYQLVRVKPSMLDKVAKASGIPLDRIPAHVREKAVRAFIETYHTKTEQKPTPKPKEAPPTHSKTVYADSVKAEAERKARQAAKATDPKRHRIPNFGYPTAANKNPSTFSQLGPRSLALIKQEGGRDIPSDVELPDMIAATLEPLKCYEPVFVGHHMIPHVGNRTGTINAGGDVYWKRPGGTRCVRATLDEAKAAIAQQMAQDEAATADLI